jgi:hypothetical protein
MRVHVTSKRRSAMEQPAAGAAYEAHPLSPLTTGDDQVGQEAGVPSGLTTAAISISCPLLRPIRSPRLPVLAFRDEGAEVGSLSVDQSVAKRHQSTSSAQADQHDSV